MKVLLAAAVCLASNLFAGNGAISQLVDEGYDHFYNLEYDAAQSDFEKAAALNPADPDLHNHLAENIVFREMYRDGALESELVTGNNSLLRRAKLNPTPETRRQFLGEIQKALDLEQARLRKNPNDIAALYAMGITCGLRANYYFLVQKAWLDALRDSTTARKMHNRVSELDPSNVDARLVQGLDDYVVGSLPPFYRMCGFLIGFHGDKDRGIRTVEDVAAHGTINRIDAAVFLAAIFRREHKPAKALPFLNDLIARFPRNYLLRFELAGMYSALGDKQKAIECVETVAHLKASGAPGYARVPAWTIYYQLGTIEFWYNDLSEALGNMQKVTAHADEVDLNTGVLAWMRVGQIYDLTRRHALAIEAYKKAIAYAPEAEAARESRRYISSPYRREKS
ncbi:MAG TPA: tetratricopeptide repeat protein [Bryobacteraceae bacterium]|nr:tetratricopeptide repeat protein [Bryobacteraceae bacterium]